MRFGAWALLLVGCLDYGRAPDVPPPSAPAPAAAPAPAPAEAPPQDAPAEPLRVAKVLETIDSGEYTYGRFDACGEEAWVAGPKTPLQVGQTVEMPVGLAMADFHSPTLKRDFPVLLFVDFYRVIEGEPDCAAAAGAPAAPPPTGHDMEEKPPPPKEVFGTVLETMESGGYRYAHLKTCGGEVWVAGPQMPIKVGEHVVTPKGMEMNGFQSSTLQRTFASIYFVPSMAISPKPPKCD